MKQNWAYQIPHYHFDGAADAGTPAPAGGAAAPPAPSSAPGAPPAATPAPSGTPSSPQPQGAPGAAPSDPFSGLDGNFDLDDGLDAVIVGDVPPTDGGAPQPSGTPTPAPAVVPASPAPPATPGPQPAPAAAPPASPVDQNASPGQQLDQTIEGFKTNSKELSAWAGQNLFKLSDEDAAALATNAEEVIPRLMGQVYTQAIAAAGNLMRSFIPQMIAHSVDQINTSQGKAKEAIGAFYKANPDLNAETHGQTVAAWAKSFRAANPKATRQEAIDYVAKAVRIQHNLPFPGAAPAAQPRQQAFAPARPGGRSPAPAAEHDPYAGLGVDFDTEA